MPPPSVNIRLKEQIRKLYSGFLRIKIKSCFYCNYCNHRVAVLYVRLHEADCELQLYCSGCYCGIYEEMKMTLGVV